MPTGPLGFPRVTNVGPFVEHDAEQRFRRDIVGGLDYREHIDRVVGSQFDVNLDRARVIRARLEVETEVEDADNIVQKINNEIDRFRNPVEVSFLRYWIEPTSGVAAIKAAHTEKDFRNMGVATQLKERELDHMREEGVDLVFTDVVSEGGYRLSKATEFKPIDRLPGDTGALEFNHKRNRGVMFRRL